MLSARLHCARLVTSFPSPLPLAEAHDPLVEMEDQPGFNMLGGSDRAAVVSRPPA